MSSLSLSAHELAALLSSRICHDLISPVGAINNALELYDDGAQDDAIDLIRMAAGNASARLQFARLAFGAFGSVEGEVELTEAQAVAETYMQQEKAKLIWRAPSMLLSKNIAKLLLNLLLVANASLPRGGEIIVDLRSDGHAPRLIFQLSGQAMRLPPTFAALYDKQTLQEPLGAHHIQFYYTLLLADLSKFLLTYEEREGAIFFSAAPYSSV
ncbi:histidine phosphotransferase ChpT [Bartonella sp. DGB2]|uniref:histidine phosphotransferase ChpT n=1 Tax=Bartonella sp. DGB2 TaxID=3388426 RepID=UPI003990395B